MSLNNTESKVQATALPPVSREFALALDRHFRPIHIRPDMSRDELFQSVGERRVIDFILRNTGNRITSSDAGLLEKPVQQKKVSVWDYFTNRIS